MTKQRQQRPKTTLEIGGNRMTVEYDPPKGDHDDFFRVHPTKEQFTAILSDPDHQRKLDAHFRELSGRQDILVGTFPPQTKPGTKR